MTAVDASPVSASDLTAPAQPIRARGKFLFVGADKFYIRGVTYGPFRPGPDGEYGSPEQFEADCLAMTACGINTLRLYTQPPMWLLDVAARHGLRILFGAAWAQHLGFLEDRSLHRDSIAQVTKAARQCRGHPAVLAYAIGNEIPTSVVRWYGYRRIERHLRALRDACKQADPDTLVTYVNYPPTEYLDLSFLDFLSFNIFLEDRSRLQRYLARIQNLASEQPLVLTEVGLDSERNGEAMQAASMSWQLRTAFTAGCAGACVFSWTDEWHRGGEDVLDWKFGLTDRARRPKPALAAVRGVLAEVPCVKQAGLPSTSVIVCTYNGGRTIRRCLEALRNLDYPGVEIIVVDDGSKDKAAAIASEFPVKLIQTPNRGLSSARNTGLEAARGDIVAYIDDDAYPDPHWLQYLAKTLGEGHAGVGGPNLPVPGDGVVAACVAHTPGNPTHVLLSDTIAEHVPGCNMAYWKSALKEIGGFDRQFRIAGDDVDVCWRLQDRGWTLGFSPSAVVWHHRRGRVKTFWRQQVNYGRAEADLERKWPEKYNAIGHARWAGRLYGISAPTTLAPSKRRVYHGVWGMALFQHVYPTHHGLIWSLPSMPEWYGVMLLLSVLSLLGLIWPPLFFLAAILAAMVLFASAQAVVHACRARIPAECSGTSRRTAMRALIAMLYLMQPMARCAGRVHYGLTPWRLRGVRGMAWPSSCRVERWSKTWKDPFHRLADIEQILREGGAAVVRGHEFAGWDLELRGGLLGRARICQFTADLPHAAQLVRLDAHPRCAAGGVLVFLISAMVCAGAASQGDYVLAGTAWLFAASLAVLAFREISAAMATFKRATERLKES